MPRLPTRLSFFVVIVVVDLITLVCRALLPAVPILTSCVNMVQYHRPINHRGILYQWRPSSSPIMGHAELPMVTMQNHLSRLHDELNLAVRQKKSYFKLNSNTDFRQFLCERERYDNVANLVHITIKID